MRRRDDSRTSGNTINTANPNPTSTAHGGDRLRLVIPSQGWSHINVFTHDHIRHIYGSGSGSSSGASMHRSHIYQGELLQFYVIIPRVAIDNQPWIKDILMRRGIDMMRARTRRTSVPDVATSSSSIASLSPPSLTVTASGDASMDDLHDISLSDNSAPNSVPSSSALSSSVASNTMVSTLPTSTVTNATSGSNVPSRTTSGNNATGNGITVLPCLFDCDIRLIDPSSSEQSALSHNHADSHSSPGMIDGSRAPSSYQFMSNNGDVVLILETIISIPPSSSTEMATLSLEVTLIPPALDTSAPLLTAFEKRLTPSSSLGSDHSGALLRDFLNKSRVTSGRPRMIPATRRVTVIQPLRVDSTYHTCGNKICLSISVENVHGMDITITAVDLHLNRTRYRFKPHSSTNGTSGAPETEPPLSDLFTLHYDRSSLPVVLHAHETYNFVLFVEPNASSHDILSRIESQFRTRYTIKWLCATVCQPILMQQKIAWCKADEHAITCTFTNDSPVPVHRSFAVNVAITLSHHFNASSSSSSSSSSPSSTNQWSLVILPSSHPMVALHRTMLASAASAASPSLTASWGDERKSSMSPLSPMGDLPAPPLLRTMSSDRATPTPTVSVFPSGAPSMATLPLLPVPLLMTHSSATTTSTSTASTAPLVTPRLTISAFTDTPTPRPSIYDTDVLAMASHNNGDASLVCLETSISLGMINPGDTRWTTLHLLALREGLLTLPPIFVHHQSSDQYYALGRLHTVFARHTTPHVSQHTK